MKIAFLNIYCGTVERGSEVFTHEIAEVLGVNNEVDVYQTGPKFNSKNYSHIILENIPYVKNQGIIYQLVVIWFTLKLLPFLLIKKYDWIIPVNGCWQAILVRIVRFISGSKILISGHAGVGRDDMLNLVIGAPNFFIALSPMAYTWAKSLYSQNAVRYIPNGINLSQFQTKIKNSIVSLPRPVVLCVGALVPYKRISLLIKAVNCTKASLLVIGDGPLKDEISKSGKDLLGDRFELILHIPHSEIHKYYQSCDLFSLPSRSSEAFGLVYLEALASNLPVVAPNDENRKKLIGEGGEFCNVEDTKEYALTIERTLSKKCCFKPEEQAAKFSWNRIGGQYESLLKNHS